MSRTSTGNAVGMEPQSGGMNPDSNPPAILKACTQDKPGEVK